VHKLFCVFLPLSSALTLGQTSSSRRTIALTFDDLPAAVGNFMNGQEILE
jgi:peptidoglycan/xylan/chitin deacetylase (PgdA/CDA1 family)